MFSLSYCLSIFADLGQATRRYLALSQLSGWMAQLQNLDRDPGLIPRRQPKVVLDPAESAGNCVYIYPV